MRAVVFGRNRSTRSTWVGREGDAESNLVVAYETARVCVGGRSFAPASPLPLPLAPPPPPNRSRSRKLACVGRSPFRLPACLAHGMGSSMLRDLGIDTTEYTSYSRLSRGITILRGTPNPTPPCHSPRLSCPSPLQNSFLANERSPITPPIVSRKSKPRLLLSRSKTHRRSRNTFTYTNVDRLHHNVPTTLQERVQVSIGYPVDPEERIGFRFPFSPSQGGYREYQSVAFSSEFDRGDLSIDGIYKPRCLQ